jgi:hypothetical protein
MSVSSRLRENAPEPRMRGIALRHALNEMDWIEGAGHDSDKERTEAAEDTDEQALLAPVVTKQEQILGRRGALF